jgi:hypothetical protein
MSDTDVAEMLKLPVEERIRLVELIWESLIANPEALPLVRDQRPNRRGSHVIVW